MVSGNSVVVNRRYHYNAPEGRRGNTMPLYGLGTSAQSRFITFPRVRQQDDCFLKAGIQNTSLLSSFRAIFQRSWSCRDLTQPGGQGWQQRLLRHQKGDAHHVLFCWKQWPQSLSPFYLQNLKLWKSNAWLGNRYIVGTCLPLSLCKLTEPFPSPTSCQAEEKWWPHSRAVTITAHISPHTLCCSAVFPWTYPSSTPCFVLWRSKTRCPE